MLHARGKLEEIDAARGKFTVRRMVQGHREQVLSILVTTLFPDERLDVYAGEFDHLIA